MRAARLFVQRLAYEGLLAQTAPGDRLRHQRTALAVSQRRRTADAVQTAPAEHRRPDAPSSAEHAGTEGLSLPQLPNLTGPRAPGVRAMLNKSSRVWAPWFGMGCKARTTAIAPLWRGFATPQTAQNRDDRAARDLFSVALAGAAAKARSGRPWREWGSPPAAFAWAF